MCAFALNTRHAPSGEFGAAEIAVSLGGRWPSLWPKKTQEGLSSKNSGKRSVRQPPPHTPKYGPAGHLGHRKESAQSTIHQSRGVVM